MNRHHLVTTSLVAAVMAASIAMGAGIARAGGGARPSVRTLIRTSLIRSAAMRSVHTQGSVVARLSTKQHGTILTIPIKAWFKGDLSARRKVAYRARALLQAGGQTEKFKVVGSGAKVAERTGSGKWVCTAASPQLMPAPVNPRQIKALRRLMRRLARSTRFASLQPSVYHGVPVWHVEATLRTRLNLNTLGISNLGTTSGLAPATRREVASLNKIPRLWIRMKADFWISEINYTLQRIKLHLKLRAKPITAVVTLNDRLWRYGEKVKVVIPKSCIAG
jgi:hypothetical protein